MENTIMIILQEVEHYNSVPVPRLELISKQQMLLLYIADIFVLPLQENSSKKASYVTGAMKHNGPKEECHFQEKM